MNFEFNSTAKGSNIPYSTEICVDVHRSTYTDLDVMQEKRVDDCWNVDSNRSLSDAWKVFTKFTLFIDRKYSQRICVVRGEMTKVQTTTRPDHVRPEERTKIGKTVKNREKQEWKNEKPKLDNARRLEGIYCIDPDDQDYGENWKDLWTRQCRAKRRLILSPGIS